MSESKKKPSSVRHTRAIQRDRSKRPTVAPPDAAVVEDLTELIHPAIYAQMAAYQDMGLRHRILTLPVMVAFVLSLIWRQIGSVSEAVRVLKREGVLWAPPLHVSQQAVAERLRTLPASLFERVWLDVLPQMQARWQPRRRPLAAVLAWAQQHFVAVLAVDGSTLDALLRKVGVLREGEGPVLGGRMAGLLDVISLLPRQLWYEENSAAHDQRFWERILRSLEAGSLLLFDSGFLNYELFDQLTDVGVWFITRAKANTAYQVTAVLRDGDRLRDQLIRLGAPSSRCRQPMRLIEWFHEGRWYRYLTNSTEPTALPAEYAVALYWQRWRLEDAFNLVKRLLGLAYLWVGSLNGIQLQVWATWLLYAVLVDLTDAVAEVLNRPQGSLSIEMVYRGLYHFTQAYHRGEASDPVAYLAQDAKDLGLLKRKPRSLPGDLVNLTSAPSP